MARVIVIHEKGVEIAIPIESVSHIIQQRGLTALIILNSGATIIADEVFGAVVQQYIGTNR